jgi:pimeloyl-ACP methyl ester carboxylesterase
MCSSPTAARRALMRGLKFPILGPSLTNIEYAERGQGPALLFVPGSFGTGAGWKPVIEKLGDGYRFVTTSLLGYGQTAERRPLGNATTMQQTEILDAIFERIAAPVHVVAHSYGGLSALAHALHGKYKAESLTLVEANPLAILRTAGQEAHFAAVGAMTEVYFAEFEAGKPDAVRHVIDFYGGTGAFDAFPAKVRDYVIATTPSNVRDWTSGMPFAPPLADYGRITAPTQVIRGAKSHPAMVRVAELLAANLPNASLETIDGGSHFLPATHPGDVAELVIAHVSKTGG